MSYCTKDLEAPQISALVISYVASRLHGVEKLGAWTPKTVEYLVGEVSIPMPRPFPPPPPPDDQFLDDLRANLLDPSRPDLPPTPGS